MTEQIITGLSQGSYVNVTSRTSSFSFRNKSMTSKQIADALDVHYLLEGSVQRDGDHVRITTQLINGSDGKHVWAEHYDYKYENLFDLQDKITMEVMTALNVSSSGFKGDASFKNLRPNNLEAYEFYLNARYIHLGRKTEEISKAREAIEKSIQLDPKFAPAYNLAGLIYLDEITRRVTKTPDQVIEKAKQCALTAEELDPDSPPYLLWSHIYRLQKDFDNAIMYGERAVKQSPNNPYFYFFLGMAQFYGERFQENKETTEIGLQLAPFRPVNFVNQLGWAYVGLEEYDNAIPLFNEVIERSPKSFFAYLSYKGLIASYELSGQHNKAVEAASNLMQNFPKYSLERDIKTTDVMEGTWRDKIFAAYQNAGLK
jgi:adenylate cyclase